jgi:hypothetical protein
VHQSRALGEQSNIIGYELGSSLAGDLHSNQDISGGELQAWMKKMTWLLTWQHFLLWEYSRGQVSWATLNPWTRNVTFGKLQLEAFI